MVTSILLLEQHVKPDYAHTPPRKHTHTHTHHQKGHCLPNDLCPSHLQSTQPFFQFPSRRMHKFPYHTTAKKLKKIYSKSLESLTYTEFNYTYIQQVQEINTNLQHYMNELAPRAL